VRTSLARACLYALRLFSCLLGIHVVGFIANWNRRKQLVEYCVAVVDQGLEAKQKIIEDQDTSPAAIRKARAEKYSEEVKVCSRRSLVEGMQLREFQA